MPSVMLFVVSDGDEEMIAALLTTFLFFAPGQAAGQAPIQISEAQKKSFIELLKTLPHKGEFFTDEAVKRAGPFLPVLFALTEKDIEKYDIYPFVALSSGLCGRKVHRDYAVRHFSGLRHPLLKLGWGSMLFNAGVASPHIVQFLGAALESEEQAKLLEEMLGPDYEDFQARVKAAQKTKRKPKREHNVLRISVGRRIEASRGTVNEPPHNSVLD